MKNTYAIKLIRQIPHWRDFYLTKPKVNGYFGCTGSFDLKPNIFHTEFFTNKKHAEEFIFNAGICGYAKVVNVSIKIKEVE